MIHPKILFVNTFPKKNFSKDWVFMSNIFRGDDFVIFVSFTTKFHGILPKIKRVRLPSDALIVIFLFL